MAQTKLDPEKWGAVVLPDNYQGDYVTYTTDSPILGHAISTTSDTCDINYDGDGWINKTIVKEEKKMLEEDILKEKIEKVKKRRKEYIVEVCDLIGGRELLEGSELQENFKKYIISRMDKKKYKIKKIKKILDGLRFCLRKYDDDSKNRYITLDHHHIEEFYNDKWHDVKLVIDIVVDSVRPFLIEFYKDELTKYSDSEGSICESCGSSNPLIAKFCNYCGKKL